MQLCLASLTFFAVGFLVSFTLGVYLGSFPFLVGFNDLACGDFLDRVFSATATFFVVLDSLEDPLEDLLFLGTPDPAECLDLDDDEPEPPATDGIVSPAA